jgi:repressor LexA
VEGLTPRQQQVLEFIRESVRANGYPPTVREICAALDLSSPSTVHAHLANLERLGLIKRDPTKPRALDVVQDLRPRRPLPLVGRVAAGQPILAEENIEELIDVPAFLRRDDDDFVLRVQGDSMADAGIFNGDFIVVHSQDQAQNGEIVVALVGDEATTKRFYNEGRTVRLQPENELYEPIIVNADEVELVGRVVGVLRQLLVPCLSPQSPARRSPTPSTRRSPLRSPGAASPACGAEARPSRS